jgi:site-specific DNA-cytosine methylase
MLTWTGRKATRARGQPETDRHGCRRARVSAVRLGGLFSGIGGFELAWQRSGGTVVWMCESDPAARRVLEARFSGVPIYPDISTLDPDRLPRATC